MEWLPAREGLAVPGLGLLLLTLLLLLRVGSPALAAALPSLWWVAAMKRRKLLGAWPSSPRLISASYRQGFHIHP